MTVQLYSPAPWEDGAPVYSCIIEKPEQAKKETMEFEKKESVCHLEPNTEHQKNNMENTYILRGKVPILRDS